MIEIQEEFNISEDDILSYQCISNSLIPSQEYKKELDAFFNSLITTDAEMIKAIVEYSKIAIRGAFLLNGAGAISLLSLLSSYKDNLNTCRQIYYCIMWLSCGALIAALASGISYFVQRYIQKYISHIGTSHICALKADYYDALVRENENQNINNKESIIKTILELRHRSEYYKNQSKVSEKYYIYYLLGTVISIFGSYLFFLISLWVGKNMFNQI